MSLWYGACIPTILNIEHICSGFLYQVSRRLYLIIQQTPTLRYCVDVRMVGYEDVPTGDTTMNLRDRARALRRELQLWEHPCLRHALTYNIPSENWTSCKWQKDAFFRRPANITRQLEVFDVASQQPAGDEDEDEEGCKDGDTTRHHYRQLEFAYDFDTFCVDADQDLIALAEYNRRR